MPQPVADRLTVTAQQDVGQRPAPERPVDVAIEGDDLDVAMPPVGPDPRHQRRDGGMLTFDRVNEMLAVEQQQASDVVKLVVGTGRRDDLGQVGFRAGLGFADLGHPHGHRLSDREWTLRTIGRGARAE